MPQDEMKFEDNTMPDEQGISYGEEERLSGTERIQGDAKQTVDVGNAEKVREGESGDEKIEEGLEDTVRLPAIKKKPKAVEKPELPETPMPAQPPAIPARPVTDKVLTPNQEKALAYLETLESKRVRQEMVFEQRMGENGDSHKGKMGGYGVAEGAIGRLPTVELGVIGGNKQREGVFYRTTEGGKGAQGAVGLMVANRGLTVQTARTQRLSRKKRLLVRHLVRKHIRQTRDDEQRSSKRFWVGMISSTLAVIFIFVSVVGGAGIAAYSFYNTTRATFSDQVSGLRSLMPRDNLKMYDMHGTMIGQLMEDGIHTTVSYEKISPNLVDATVATEDKDFWTNKGIDLVRILQSAIQNLQHREIVGGGSTITQQLVKNLVIKNQSQDIMRKLQELVLAPDLNEHYKKQDIMEMYLNSNFYGEQAYGADAAASVYFGLEDKPGKPAIAQLTLAQAAMLAGIPNLPSKYDPWLNREAAFDRMDVVLEAMVRTGKITRIEKADAWEEAHKPGFFKHPRSIENKAPHFFEFVLLQLGKQFHQTRKQLVRSGMQVYTTLDLDLQNTILQIARKQVESLSWANVTNSAEVLIDYHTGAVRTLLGSVDYNSTSIDGKFDVATDGYRQMGSSFKPYMYATAFEMGVSPGQAVADIPTMFPDPSAPGGHREFHDYDLMTHGHMTIRCAFQNSLNIPALKVMQHTGVDKVLDTLKRLDLTDYLGDPGLAVALGSLNMHLLDHVSAFGTFANGGVHMPYYTVEKVVFTNTGQTYGHAKTEGKRVFSPQIAYMITDVLSDNVQRTPQFGACHPLILRRGGDCWVGDLIPVAAKTGTTNDFRDVLTVGYTSEYILGVWAGNNNNSQMNGINGIMGAAPIWHDAMLAAMQGREAKAFVYPGGLEKVDQVYADGVKTNDWVLPGYAQPVPTVTPTPENNKGHGQKPPTQKPPTQAYGYCPCYSFAFQPPASTQQPPAYNTSPYPAWW